jgi:hypothetical protein
LNRITLGCTPTLCVRFPGTPPLRADPNTLSSGRCRHPRHKMLS